MDLPTLAPLDQKEPTSTGEFLTGPNIQQPYTSNTQKERRSLCGKDFRLHRIFARYSAAQWKSREAPPSVNRLLKRIHVYTSQFRNRAWRGNCKVTRRCLSPSVPGARCSAGSMRSFSPLCGGSLALPALPRWIGWPNRPHVYTKQTSGECEAPVEHIRQIVGLPHLRVYFPLNQARCAPDHANLEEVRSNGAIKKQVSGNSLLSRSRHIDSNRPHCWA